MDRHYTPAALADAIISKLPNINPPIAADFAAGEGALLKAIRRRWPKCKLRATDIDARAVNRLRAELPKSSSVGVCDFFNTKSRARSPVVGRRRAHFPFIFLNPPFSSRGRRTVVQFEETTLLCSRALAFVALSLEYVSADGRLIALLPSSCFTSERDAGALRVINKSYIVKILSTPEPARFVGCSVDVVVVQFQRRKVRLRLGGNGTNIQRFDAGIKLQLQAAVTRGHVAMPDAATHRVGRGHPLVHTTSLRNGKIIFDQGHVSQRLKSFAGPIILISRVGRPTTGKLCLYVECKPIVLSECIIAIKGHSASATRILFSLLQTQSRLLMQCYVGSCAKYLTIARLTEFLSSFGVTVTSFDQMEGEQTDARLKAIG